MNNSRNSNQVEIRQVVSQSVPQSGQQSKCGIKNNQIKKKLENHSYSILKNNNGSVGNIHVYNFYTPFPKNASTLVFHCCGCGFSCGDGHDHQKKSIGLQNKQKSDNNKNNRAQNQQQRQIRHKDEKKQQLPNDIINKSRSSSNIRQIVQPKLYQHNSKQIRQQITKKNIIKESIESKRPTSSFGSSNQHFIQNGNHTYAQSKNQIVSPNINLHPKPKVVFKFLNPNNIGK